MSCIRGDILEYDEFFRRVGESAAAVFRDEHHVLYSDSEKSGQIDAGLRGDKMSGGENLFRAGRYARLLVNLYADSVTRAVLYIFFCSSLTEPTATVRVMSLWYPPTTAP